MDKMYLFVERGLWLSAYLKFRGVFKEWFWGSTPPPLFLEKKSQNPPKFSRPYKTNTKSLHQKISGYPLLEFM